jgi:hypothetical protein
MGPLSFAMSYTNTFIRIAPDSSCQTAKVPPLNPDRRTIASLQHELLTAHPGSLTEQELHYRVHCLRLGLSPVEMETQRATIWAELFRKPQACLRASPLPKSYGWRPLRRDRPDTPGGRGIARLRTPLGLHAPPDLCHAVEAGHLTGLSMNSSF